MNDWISEQVARLLAHRAGFAAFNLFTGVWFAVTLLLPAWLGVPVMAVFVISLAGYLDVVTWMGGATQFTLAYQNHKAERALELALRNQADSMRLLVSLAERDASIGEQLLELVNAMDVEIDKLGEVAIEARKRHEKNAELIERLLDRGRPIMEAALEHGDPA